MPTRDVFDTALENPYRKFKRTGAVPLNPAQPGGRMAPLGTYTGGGRASNLVDKRKWTGQGAVDGRNMPPGKWRGLYPKGPLPKPKPKSGNTFVPPPTNTISGRSKQWT